jgi:hypothetical protein
MPMGVGHYWQLQFRLVAARSSSLFLQRTTLALIQDDMVMKVRIDECTSAFRNAHVHILDRFETTRPKQKQVINTWLKVFGIRVHTGAPVARGWSVWEALEFRDQEHYMEWLLRWSN